MNRPRNKSTRRAGRAGSKRLFRCDISSAPKYTALVRCRRSQRCPICGKPDWCSVAADGSFAICMRQSRGSDRRTRNGGFLHRLRLTEEIETRPSRPAPAPSIVTTPTVRHGVYIRLLEGLFLSGVHAAQLTDRGLSEETITRNLYATVPDARLLAEVADAVAGEILCSGVPGFWLDRDGWNIAARPGDLLIPVRNIEHQIVGIVMRSEDSARRYRWLSSRDRAHGAPATASIHYSLRRSRDEVRFVIVTEGVLKADVVLELEHAVDGVIGLPGVAFASAAVEQIVRALPNLTRARIAFDADFRTNDAVARALHTVISGLNGAGVSTDVMTWDPAAGKGLDDVLRGQCR